jgi:hypothetical protein
MRARTLTARRTGFSAFPSPATHGQAEKPVLRTPRQYGLLVSQRQNDGGWQTLYPHFDAT